MGLVHVSSPNQAFRALLELWGLELVQIGWLCMGQAKIGSALASKGPQHASAAYDRLRLCLCGDTSGGASAIMGTAGFMTDAREKIMFENIQDIDERESI